MAKHTELDENMLVQQTEHCAEKQESSQKFHVQNESKAFEGFGNT